MATHGAEAGAFPPDVALEQTEVRKLLNRSRAMPVLGQAQP